jgi:cytochrome c oxidase cbb3-type subunit 3
VRALLPKPAVQLRPNALSQILLIAASLFCILATSCKREERAFRVEPPAANTTYLTSMTDFAPASTQPAQPVKNPYEGNALALSAGQQLYLKMNCVGCHFHGGGGIGPPLMDDNWIYGGQPEQIFSTIVEGRPNGMPSFRGKIPDAQVWQIVAYVRSMSGNASPQASPGRLDSMWLNSPENSRQQQPPRQSFTPKSAEMPG